MKISVVFSFYNEEENLPELLKRLRSTFDTHLSSYKAEWIFVNDLSTDRSLEILRHEAKTDPRVVIINMTRNFGVNPCVMAGLDYSTGDAVVMMDTDLQDPPELIPELVKKWRDGVDVVYTVRTYREKEPALKMFVTRIGYRILKWLSNVDMPIQSGDFRLMSRRVVEKVCALKEQEPFIRGLVRWVGFRQEPVYYRREGRFGGETHFIFYRSKVLKNFISGITSFSDTPLYLTFTLGLFTSGAAFTYLLGVIIMKFCGWNLPGWSAIMATMLFLGGIQILAIGILGLYIAKVHIEAKGRPRYIVESTENEQK